MPAPSSPRPFLPLAARLWLWPAAGWLPPAADWRRPGPAVFRPAPADEPARLRPLGAARRPLSVRASAWAQTARVHRRLPWRSDWRSPRLSAASAPDRRRCALIAAPRRPWPPASPQRLLFPL